MTKRKNILTLLNNYFPENKEEIQFKVQIIDFIRNNKDCFERSLKTGHITGSAWLLNKKGSHALLMHHTKLDKWFQLGGHCDGNPDVCSVAVKEAQEESGIQSIAPIKDTIFDLDVHLIPVIKDEPEHYHFDIRFLLQVKSDEDIIQNKESKELRWINKDKKSIPTDNQSVVRMFDKWIKFNNQ